MKKVDHRTGRSRPEYGLARWTVYKSKPGGACMTDRDRVLRKIRALLQKTVANGCPVEEALAAHAKVQLLIDEHQVSHEELYGTGPGRRWRKPEPEAAEPKQQRQQEQQRRERQQEQERRERQRQEDQERQRQQERQEQERRQQQRREWQEREQREREQRERERQERERERKERERERQDRERKEREREQRQERERERERQERERQQQQAKPERTAEARARRSRGFRAAVAFTLLTLIGSLGGLVLDRRYKEALNTQQYEAQRQAAEREAQQRWEVQHQAEVREAERRATVIAPSDLSFSDVTLKGGNAFATRAAMITNNSSTLAGTITNNSGQTLRTVVFEVTLKDCPRGYSTADQCRFWSQEGARIMNIPPGQTRTFATEWIFFGNPLPLDPQRPLVSSWRIVWASPCVWYAGAGEPPCGASAQQYEQQQGQRPQSGEQQAAERKAQQRWEAQQADPSANEIIQQRHDYWRAPTSGEHG